MHQQHILQLDFHDIYIQQRVQRGDSLSASQLLEERIQGEEKVFSARDIRDRDGAGCQRSAGTHSD